MKKTVISVCLLASIIFIFHNSLEPAVVSSQRSGGLLEILQTAFGKIHLDFLTEHMLRKMAHFSEFALEGTLLYLFFHEVVSVSHSAVPGAAFAGLLTAMADETIQLFVEGRSAQVTDVWIDFAGVITGIVLMKFFCWLLAHMRQRECIHLR